MKVRGAGKVVSIRVNPTDCISCVDVADALKLDTRGLSFDQVVRLALSSLLQTAREHALIPEPDGFSFSAAVLQRFPAGTRHARAFKRENTLSLQQAGKTVPPLVQQSNEQRKAKFRLDELQLKRESGEVMSAEDETEWAQLITAVYNT